MTAALSAATAATVGRAIDIYVRELAAGRSETYARAFAATYATAFGKGLLKGLAQSFEVDRREERARLKAIRDSRLAQSADAQRWLMALALGASLDGAAVISPANGRRH